MVTNTGDAPAEGWDELLDFSAFAVKKTGLISSETILTVDEFSLHAAFYKASASKILLLVALSRHEVALFRKFENAFAGITMAYQQAGAKRPLRIFARCTIARIAEMSQREGVSVIETEIKPVPDDLRRILEEYRALLSCLKEDYAQYSNQPMRLTPDLSRLLGYNNYAELHAYGGRFELALYSLASNRLEFLLKAAPPDIAPGNDNSVKLFFQAHQFFVHGKATEVQQVSPGVVRVVMDLEFSPELMDILARYRERVRMLSSPQAGGDTAAGD